MTTRPTPGAPWDDERLAAAFAARAAQAVTPGDLASATSAAIRTRASSAGTWRRLLAPAAVVILAIGAVSGALALRGSIGADPAGGPTPEPSPSPSPSGSWAGGDTMGLPTISVTDAIAIRDAGIDDREIAVHGWFWPVAPIPCVLPPPTSLEPVCLDRYIVLMAEPESLGTGGSSGYSGDRPTSPSFEIDLDDLDSGWQPALPASRPVEIAVVGHFDDRRWTYCLAEQQGACRDRFVVDRVDWADGQMLPTSIVDYLEGTGSPFDEAQAVIDAVRPGVTVLSAAHATSWFDLRRVEPSFGERPIDLDQQAAMWIVRVLDHGALATYVVLDTTGSIYELTADGPVLVALGTPGEPASPEPSPIPRVQSAFTIEIGPADRPVSIDVLDRTGFLEDARGVTSREMTGHSDIPPAGKLGISNLRQDTILVRWIGSVCDRKPQLSVNPRVVDGPPSVLHLTDERPGCDTMGIGRGVVLRFSMDVDARDLAGTENVKLEVEPPPEPTTMVVELERGDSTESVVIIDHAGSLMEARAANPIPVLPEFTGMRIVRADDGGTIVVWNGALCDRDLWISIEADDTGPPDRIVVHGTSALTCRTALVRRAVWLDLGPVDVASIGVGLAVGPSTGGPRDPGPIIGVAEALVVRSHAGDDHQLQVRGWYWRDPVIYDCFVPPSPPPALDSGCHGPRDRLVADPEDVTGPGFLVWPRPGVETALLRYGDRSEVVVVGHFADTLAEACPASTRDECQDVFVIDEVLPTAAP